MEQINFISAHNEVGKEHFNSGDIERQLFIF